MTACFLSNAGFFVYVLIMFTISSSRRTFLLRSAQVAKMAAAAGLLATAGMPYAHAFAPSPKRANFLAFEYLHTNERLSLVYAVDGAWLPQAKSQLDYFLRDHYTGDVGVIDPQLFDLLHRLRMTLGVRQPYQVISGYRTAFTNEILPGRRRESLRGSQTICRTCRQQRNGVGLYLFRWRKLRRNDRELPQKFGNVRQMRRGGL